MLFLSVTPEVTPRLRLGIERSTSVTSLHWRAALGNSSLKSQNFPFPFHHPHYYCPSKQARSVLVRFASHNGCHRYVQSYTYTPSLLGFGQFALALAHPCQHMLTVRYSPRAESPRYSKEHIDAAESQVSSHTDGDLPPLTTTTARKLQAKVDWHILPCLCILYLLAFLDR